MRLVITMELRRVCFAEHFRTFVVVKHVRCSGTFISFFIMLNFYLYYYFHFEMRIQCKGGCRDGLKPEALEWTAGQASSHIQKGGRNTRENKSYPSASLGGSLSYVLLSSNPWGLQALPPHFLFCKSVLQHCSSLRQGILKRYSFFKGNFVC